MASSDGRQNCQRDVASPLAVREGRDGSEGKGGIMAGQLVVFSEDGKSSLCQKQLNPWTLKPS